MQHYNGVFAATKKQDRPIEFSYDLAKDVDGFTFKDI